jgi:hypothetical protein
MRMGNTRFKGRLAREKLPPKFARIGFHTSPSGHIKLNIGVYRESRPFEQLAQGLLVTRFGWLELSLFGWVELNGFILLF